MTTLLNITITGAISVTTGTVYYYGQRKISRAATIQANFTYGSGGTTVDAYVQTSLDGGATWCDVAHYGLTTSTVRNFNNFSSLTPVATGTSPGGVALTDGTMTTTFQDGLIGDRWRVKYKSTGTYAGGTTLQIDIITDQLQTYP